MASVGFSGRILPFSHDNKFIKTFRQALALDERRTQFRASPWSWVCSFTPDRTITTVREEEEPETLKPKGDVDKVESGPLFPIVS